MAFFPLQKSLTIGGQVFPDRDAADLIILGAGNDGNPYSTFRTADGTAYVVPGGKTLYVEAVAIWSESGGGSVGISIGYGDNDVGINSASPPTNLVFAYGNETVARVVFPGVSSNVDPGYFDYDFKVLTGKYPCYKTAQANCTAKIYGYLK